MRSATDFVTAHALRSRPVASAAMATLTTIALAGHSAENNDKPESTPNAARMG
jgi:hypothetical protein